MRKLVQWRKKCIADSIYLPHSHKGFKVSWKQCLNLCSWRWLRPRRNLVKSLIPRGLWISKILLALGRMKFRIFFLKVLRLAGFLMLRSSLFHSDIAEGKTLKNFSEAYRLLNSLFSFRQDLSVTVYLFGCLCKKTCIIYLV